MILFFATSFDNRVSIFGTMVFSVTSYLGLGSRQWKSTLPHSPFFIVLLLFFMICIAFVFRCTFCLNFLWRMNNEIDMENENIFDGRGVIFHFPYLSHIFPIDNKGINFEK